MARTPVLPFLDSWTPFAAVSSQEHPWSLPASLRPPRAEFSEITAVPTLCLARRMAFPEHSCAFHSLPLCPPGRDLRAKWGLDLLGSWRGPQEMPSDETSRGAPPSRAGLPPARPALSLTLALTSALVCLSGSGRGGTSVLLCPPVLVSTFPKGTVNQGHGSGPGAPRAPLPLLGGLTGPAVLGRPVFPEPAHGCPRKTPVPCANLASRAPVLR